MKNRYRGTLSWCVKWCWYTD